MKNINDNNAADFQQESDNVFGRIAESYDRLCDLFSLGIHRLWKRKVAKTIAAEQWQNLLDTGTGTGDIVLRVLQGNTSNVSRNIVASDISLKMLKVATSRLRSTDTCMVEIKAMNSESLSEVTSNSYDCYSMSLVLKICNRKAAMEEAYRVLKPGGLAVFLEASNIPNKFIQNAYLKYMEICMPAIGWIATRGDSSAYKYLLNGIRGFPSAENLKLELQEVGFTDVTFERLSLGIVAIHKARKPKNA